MRIDLNNFKYMKIFFGFLFNFMKLKSPDDDSLQKYYLNLKSFLEHDVYYDINGYN